MPTTEPPRFCIVCHQHGIGIPAPEHCKAEYAKDGNKQHAYAEHPGPCCGDHDEVCDLGECRICGGKVHDAAR